MFDVVRIERPKWAITALATAAFCLRGLAAGLAMILASMLHAAELLCGVLRRNITAGLRGRKVVVFRGSDLIGGRVVMLSAEIPAAEAEVWLQRVCEAGSLLNAAASRSTPSAKTAR